MILADVQSILEKLGYPSSLIPEVGLLKNEQMLVVLGADSKERERLLTVTLLEQRVPDKFASGKEDMIPMRLEFQSVLPFKAEEETAVQVAHLLLFLNPFLDLPGFQLKEVDGEIAYRYVWLTHQTLVKHECIVAIIGATLLNLTLFEDLIELVASGQKTFNQLLTSIIETVEMSR